MTLPGKAYRSTWAVLDFSIGGGASYYRLSTQNVTRTFCIVFIESVQLLDP